VASSAERIVLLQAAIAGQESLRRTVGDAVVETSIAALQDQLDALSAGHFVEPTDRTLAHMQHQLPQELAARARSTPRREGEIKDVTIVFADLSDFTTLSERLDPEEIRALQNELFPRVARVVYQYEGFLEKFVGDAVLAVFGAPVTHEDDPERALRAALAMRERVAELSQQWIARLRQPLSLHVAINSGRVVAGALMPEGDEPDGAYAVTGDPVNTAARVLGQARAGQILVGELTYELTRHAFSFVALESVMLKGKREPLRLYELQQARMRPDRQRSSPELGTVFVGREEDLAGLCGLADRLCRGTGCAVLVVGEAGIGKSRLIAKWREESAGRIRWIEGQCFPHTANVLFGPFVDAVRRQAGIREVDSDAEARHKLAAMVDATLPDNPEAQLLFAYGLALRMQPDETMRLESMPIRTRRERLFGFVKELIARLAQEQPVVFVMEDLHWADSASIELLEHLLPLTLETQLAIVGVSRSDNSLSLDRLRQALDALPQTRVRHVSLDPLPEKDAVRMAEQLLSTPRLSGQLRSLILTKAEGNPFFVEEVIRSLIEQGALVRADAGRKWAVTQIIDTVAVPDGLKGLLMARLDRLPDETRWVAQQASVIGRVIPDHVLRELVGNSPTLDADLAQLEREGIIRELSREPEVEYTFKHALTQQAAYQSLLMRRRRELHLRVGEVMEVLNADRLGGVQAVLGEHFFRGGAWDKASAYYLTAGDAAAHLPAELEARRSYTRALEALDRAADSEDNRRRRVDATLGLVSVSLRVDASANLERLHGVEPIACALSAPDGSQSGDAHRCARVYFWMGRAYYLLGQPEQALAQYGRVIDLARGLGDEELEAAASYSTGVLMNMRGYYGAAEPLLVKGLAPLERAANWSELIQALGFLGINRAARGQYASGLNTARDGLQRATALKSPTAMALSHMCLGLIHMYGGDWQQMQAECRATVDLAQECGDRVTAYVGTLGLALAESRLGYHAAAQEAIERAVATGVHAVPENRAAFAGEVALNSGQLDLALAQAREAVSMAQASGVISAEGLGHRVWAQTLARVDPSRWEDVDAHFASSVRLFESGECTVEAARTELAWGLACRESSHPAADDHLRRAAEWLESFGLQAELARVRELLGGVRFQF
jgi:class 3 adenylate cyclase/tetratricopeptide (TPR) repeat protein